MKIPLTVFRQQLPFFGLGVGKRLLARQCPLLQSQDHCVNLVLFFYVSLCSDTIHTRQAIKTLLLPLDILTGQTLVTGKTNICMQWKNIRERMFIFLFFFCVEDDQRHWMADQLKSKSKFISLVCVCLTNVPQITLMVSTAWNSLAC